MIEPDGLDQAYGVLRAAGSDNVVVRVQPGADCARNHAADPTAVFHDGMVVRAQLDGSGAGPMAEIRAALLVIATEENGERPKLDLSDKDVAYLRLVCDGLSDADCADRLGLSLRAIKSRKKSVLAGTSSQSLSHAVKRFLREYRRER